VCGDGQLISDLELRFGPVPANDGRHYGKKLAEFNCPGKSDLLPRLLVVVVVVQVDGGTGV